MFFFYCTYFVNYLLRFFYIFHSERIKHTFGTHTIINRKHIPAYLIKSCSDKHLYSYHAILKCFQKHLYSLISKMMTTRKIITLVAVAFILFFSLNSCCESPKPATVEELGKMNRDFAKALIAKDAAAAAGVYDVNASLLPPNEQIITGRANIQAYWQGAIDAGLIDAKVKTIAASSDGDLGYEIGTFTLKFLLEDGTILVDIGKYTEILQRNEDGYWISLYGMWSANEPMPAH